MDVDELKFQDEIIDSWKNNVSIENLEKLLEEKKRAEAEENIPKALPEPDMDRIKAICGNYINYLISEDFHPDNDEEHLLFEEVMKTVFGDDIFDWINKQINSYYKGGK